MGCLKNDNDKITAVAHTRMALIFRGSLISRISRIWNRSRNLFNENLSHCAVTPMGNMNSRNLFNEFLQSSYSRKFRPAKYKYHTVIMMAKSSSNTCSSTHRDMLPVSSIFSLSLSLLPLSVSLLRREGEFHTHTCTKPQKG